jgi:IS5 family transposase
MTHADEILGDEEILATVYEALAKRHPKSRSRGRPAAPAEMVSACSFSSTSETAATKSSSAKPRANLVYRDFTRMGAGKMPDAKTMGRWGWAVARR